MACKTCGSNKKNNTLTSTSTNTDGTREVLEFNTPVDFTTIEPIKSTVTSVKGRFPINNSLLAMSPTGGWRVSIKYKGVTHSFQAPNYNDLFDKVKVFYQLNQTEISDTQLHFNLNLIFTKTQQTKTALVQHKDLVGIMKTGLVKEAEPTSFLIKRDGGICWRYICRALAMSKEEYNQQLFLNILRAELEMLQLPSIGCEECSKHFEDFISSANFTTRDAARKAVHEQINAIRIAADKPTMTYRDCTFVHHWKD
jgi:hypothetical protein